MIKERIIIGRQKAVNYLDAASNMESSSSDNEDPFADEQGFAIKSHIADLNEDEESLDLSSSNQKPDSKKRFKSTFASGYKSKKSSEKDQDKFYFKKEEPNTMHVLPTDQ